MTDNPTETRSGLKFWAPMIAASLALFIVVVDSTMMNVAVPTIVKDLNTNVTSVQGVIAMYSLIMLLLATFLPKNSAKSHRQNGFPTLKSKPFSNSTTSFDSQ